MAKTPKADDAPKKPRGRPPGTGKAKTEKAAKPPKEPKAPKESKGRTRTIVVNSEDKALFLQHLPKIVAGRDAITKATNALRTIYKTAKSDGFHKVDFDDAIEIATADGEKKRKAAIARSLTVAGWMGCDLGAQLDLFLEGSVVPIGDRAYAEGQTASMTGKTANPSYDPSTEAYREYMRGYHEHQESIVKNANPPETPGLITAAQKEAAEAAKNAPKPPAEAPTSGVPMTRAQFKAQQNGGGGGPRAEAEKLFKKAAAPQ